MMGASVEKKRMDVDWRAIPIHVVLMYLAFCFGIVLSLSFSVFLPQTRGGNLLFRHMLGEPFWIPEIVAGLVIGWFSYRRWPAKSAFWTWLIPAVFLGVSAASWQVHSSLYDSTWNTFFAFDCGNSECLYQLLFTAPLYTGFGYAVGAYLARKVRIRTDFVTNPEPRP